MKPIPARAGWVQGRYALSAGSASARAEWEEFAEREPTAAKETFERLSSEPLTRQPKRQFPLRGQAQKPFWEYEATGADRVWYAVNIQNMTVIVACRRDIHTGDRVAKVIKKRRKGFDEAPAPSTPAELDGAGVPARINRPRR